MTQTFFLTTFVNYLFCRYLEFSYSSVSCDTERFGTVCVKEVESFLQKIQSELLT